MKKSFNYNRLGYGAFLFLAAYYAFVNADFVEAASAMGIALIFDPFNQETPFNKRPKWQQAWLIVHLGLAAASLGFGIGTDHALI
jgi:hypothetical protein